MRTLKILALCVALGGCGALWQQEATTTRLGDQSIGQNLIGQNVTSLVARFGKPISKKKMDNDQTSYVWELDDATDSSGNERTYSGQAGLYGDGRTPGYMSDDPRFCKLSVTASPEGVVTQVNTEDSNGTGAPAMVLGINGSICARRLGIKPRT
jgi:hypothetical protein